MFYGEIMLKALKTLIKFITISLPYICVGAFLAVSFSLASIFFGAGNAIIAKDAYKSVFVPHNSNVNSSSSDVNASGDSKTQDGVIPVISPGEETDVSSKKDKKDTDIISDNSKYENDEYIRGYIVKRYGDIIGVFDAGDEIPFLTIDVFVFTLPDYEQEQLKSGIIVPANELEELIEAYTS
jgi:hypothetical protein